MFDQVAVAVGDAIVVVWVFARRITYDLPLKFHPADFRVVCPV